ncbi:hypothetical protein IJM86_01255 [bacterium]|nr:hypothetical protein [bacterium]
MNAIDELKKKIKSIKEECKDSNKKKEQCITKMEQYKIELAQYAQDKYNLTKDFKSSSKETSDLFTTLFPN